MRPRKPAGAPAPRLRTGPMRQRIHGCAKGPDLTGPAPSTMFPAAQKGPASAPPSVRSLAPERR
jgi:hypothetical protein